MELLQGKLSKGVMEVVTAHDGGLFPKPREIEMACSCPDWAGMCKHVAAVLYGVGARARPQPELLFVLRKVDHLELIEEADDAAPARRPPRARRRSTRATSAGVFGIELAEPEAAPPAPKPRAAKKPAARPAKKAAPKAKEPAAKARRSPKSR